MGKRPCSVHVSVTGTVCFLKSQSYLMITFSQYLYVVWTFAAMKCRFWKIDEIWCIQQWRKCWKCWCNYPSTLIFQESVCPMGPKDVIFNRKAQHVAVSAEHLHWFELEGSTFLECIVTCDETECTSLLQSQSIPAWNDVTRKRNLHHLTNSRQLSAVKIMTHMF
jgi:hypothetical protein